MSDSSIDLTKKKKKKVENFIYDARLLIWSSDSSKTRRNRFSFIHYNDKKDKYQFFLGQFDDNPTKPDLYPLPISGLTAKRVVDYTRMSHNEKDYNLAIISDRSKVKSIQFVGKSLFDISIPNLSEIATEIYIHDSRQVLLTVRDKIGYSDVYYFMYSK